MSGRPAGLAPGSRSGTRAAVVAAAGLGLLVAAALQPGCGASQSATPGQRDYEKSCAYCHGMGGAGNRIVPPLRGEWLETPALGRIIFDGLVGTIEVEGTSYSKGMAGFRDKLSDDEVARIMTFVQRRFGGREDAEVKVAEVTAMREETSEHRGPWRAQDLRPLLER